MIALSRFLVVLGALAMLAAGCTGGRAETAAPEGEQGFVSGSGTIQVLDVADRQPAPALSGTTLDGESLDLASLQGNVVLINVWASWCAPCRAEAPALVAVYEEMRDEGVEFVGIDTRDDDANAKAFERNLEIPYPSLVDPDGELVLKFRETLPPQAIPTTLVIDREGRVAARALTPLTVNDLRELLSAVLDDDSSP